MPRFLVLIVAGTFASACGGSVQPSPIPTPTPSPFATPSPGPAPLTITSVEPTAGWPFYYMEIYGTGFRDPGLRVTIGGVASPFVNTVGDKLTLWPEWQPPGVVDVVVSRSDGASVTLRNGFTIKAATLLLSKSEAAPNETLTLTWSGPPDPSDFAPCDRIGVYLVGDAHNTSLWDTCSGVGEQFSTQFKAPSAAGDYEVRYHMLSAYLLARIPLTVR